VLIYRQEYLHTPLMIYWKLSRYLRPEVCSPKQQTGDQMLTLLSDAATQFRQLGKAVPKSPSSTESFDFLKECDRICLTNYEACRKCLGDRPSRLVNIATTPWKLDEIGLECDVLYAALSYR
jgi:hypothetical protein